MREELNLAFHFRASKAFWFLLVSSRYRGDSDINRRTEKKPMTVMVNP